MEACENDGICLVCLSIRPTLAVEMALSYHQHHQQPFPENGWLKCNDDFVVHTLQVSKPKSKLNTF